MRAPSVKRDRAAIQPRDVRDSSVILSLMCRAQGRHRGDRKRFVVQADEKLTAFLELEAATQAEQPMHEKC